MPLTPKGTWLTNHPRTWRGWFPRRVAKFIDGPPKATALFSVEELQERKIVGVYLDEDVPEGISNRPLIQAPSR